MNANLTTGATEAVALLNRLSGEMLSAPASRFDVLAREMTVLEGTLRTRSDEAFACGRTGADVQLGILCGQVAVRLAIADKALRTAFAYVAASHPLHAQVADINRELAHGNLLDALGVLGRILWARLPVASGSPSLAGAAQEAVLLRSAESLPADASLRANIALYHRDHERYYVQERTAAAADLYKEANKLRILADRWSQVQPSTQYGGTDFGDPAYAPVGCTDLNARLAIAAIGVLFMEGEQEPIEIKVMKSKLASLASAWRRAGEWLSTKMDAAWDRELAMYEATAIAAAYPRYCTIAINWRGAHERLLTARALESALQMLEEIPFAPTSLRGALAHHGENLGQAAAMMSLAAQLVARTAADLADNDENWMACIAHAGEGHR